MELCPRDIDWPDMSTRSLAFGSCFNSALAVFPATIVPPNRGLDGTGRVGQLLGVLFLPELLSYLNLGESVASEFLAGDNGVKGVDGCGGSFSSEADFMTGDFGANKLKSGIFMFGERGVEIPFVSGFLVDGDCGAERCGRSGSNDDDDADLGVHVCFKSGRNVLESGVRGWLLLS